MFGWTFPGFGAFISKSIASCRLAATCSAVSMFDGSGMDVHVCVCRKVLLGLC